MAASKLLLAMLLAIATPVSSPAPACRLRVGSHVVLFSAGANPAVFVWDSRFRMSDYEAGSFDQAQALLPHAFLAPPGTRAIVESCVARFVQSKYDPHPADAVGIVIVTGSLHGKRGWVMGTDVRLDTTGVTRRLRLR
jgi:hypothetical protein